MSVDLHYSRCMHGPTGPPSRKRSILSYAAVRWTLAAIVGVTVTAMLFVGMTRMIDGAWILERVLRVFPLEQSEPLDPCEIWQAEQTLVAIEGAIGYAGRAGFVALPDARIVGKHGHAPPQQVDVSGAGSFRFLTPFEEQRPESCAEPGSAAAPLPRLLVQAPGCLTRSVPISRNWLPHRVLLDCEARP